MDNKILHTRKRYLALAGVFLLLGLGLVFLPDKDNKKEMKPEHLLAKLVDKSRFISTDDVADQLINNDPTMILIDVRSKDEYDKGSLPGALNIPLSEILNESSTQVFQRKSYDKVLFGNSDIYADQAWILLSRNLMGRTYVMKGGLNHWMETIINPTEPNPAEPIENFELYHARVAASRYFAGQNTAFIYSDGDFTNTNKKPASSQTKPKVSTPTGTVSRILA